MGEPLDHSSDRRADRCGTRGGWDIFLTPTKPVPKEWFPELSGCRVLCLASGGGQQGPILAAAGADVTVLDNSPAQLAQDRMVAQRDGLDITTVEGSMADLSMFADASFDLIINRGLPRRESFCTSGTRCRI